MAISANNEEARNEEKVIQIMCEWRERGGDEDSVFV